MYRLATKCTENRIECQQCEQSVYSYSAWRLNIDDDRMAVKASIRTARRKPCRQYDRLSQQQLSFLLLLGCNVTCLTVLYKYPY